MDNSTFKISSKEKTILDSLTYPQHYGGIPEAAKAIWNSREELDWGLLIDFLERLDVSAVKRRLGYVLEVLETKEDVKSMLESEFKGYR
ncbi:MAG: transcriptional regulator, partial [Archaeoglobaceae archaeon]